MKEADIELRLRDIEHQIMVIKSGQQENRRELDSMRRSLRHPQEPYRSLMLVAASIALTAVIITGCILFI